MKNVLTIPLSALGDPVGDNRYKVKLLRNGETREREVTIGARNDTDVEIVKGLEAGDEVVIGEAKPGSCTMTPLLELKDIRRSYPAGDEQVEVLKGITLDIYAGEMVAIVGASGSGKSTLMNILGCLDKATSGTYRVAGQDVATLDADALAQLRREHFGFIFQRYHLLSHLTAEQNVEVPAVYAGLERKQRLLRAQELLQRLGLEDRTEYYPAQLSGGQQQRVSIARALMNGGQVILADEPTGALDSHSGEEVMAILHQLRDRGHTVIIVTHDPQVAAQAERVIEIRDGEIVRNPPAIEKVNVAGGTEPVVNTVSGWRQFVSGFNEALTMAWRALAANKMRTLLTMLGIIIGIASVVSIVVVGDAAKQMVLADIRSIGTNTIDVYPGKDFGDDDPQYQQALKYDDLIAIQKTTVGRLSHTCRLAKPAPAL